MKNEKLKDKIGDLDWSLLDAETEKKKALEFLNENPSVKYYVTSLPVKLKKTG